MSSEAKIQDSSGFYSFQRLLLTVWINVNQICPFPHFRLLAPCWQSSDSPVHSQVKEHKSSTVISKIWLWWSATQTYSVLIWKERILQKILFVLRRTAAHCGKWEIKKRNAEDCTLLKWLKFEEYLFCAQYPALEYLILTLYFWERHIAAFEFQQWNQHSWRNLQFTNKRAKGMKHYKP